MNKKGSKFKTYMNHIFSIKFHLEYIKNFIIDKVARKTTKKCSSRICK